MKATITSNVIVETDTIADACFVRDLLNALQIKYDEHSGLFTITREIKYFE